jgi:hypothetical protein
MCMTAAGRYDRRANLRVPGAPTSIATQRFSMLLLAAFGGIAIVLATIGTASSPIR